MAPRSQFEFCHFYNTLSYTAVKNFVNINKVFFSFWPVGAAILKTEVDFLEYYTIRIYYCWEMTT